MKKGFAKMFPVLLVGLGMLLVASVSHAAIPNLKGVWAGTVNIVRFENVLQDGGNPVYHKETIKIKITWQNGRVFAGRYMSGEHEEKLTGVIEADNTVTVQTFNEDNRSFFRGKMRVVDGTMTLSGAIAVYEEICLSGSPEMMSGLATLKKVK